MTSKQYQRLEGLLAAADEITMEHPLLTPQGKKIQNEIRNLLTLIIAEKFRAQEREGLPLTEP
jgi:hypothetical protein